jgi:hemerythrin-like domain-containing protein
METATREYQREPRAARKRWAEATREYSQLLRDHIMKEDKVLFCMAEQIPSPEEQTSLAADFEKAQIEKMGVGTHKRLNGPVARLDYQDEGSSVLGH